jgi:hypothetical protein
MAQALSVLAVLLIYVFLQVVQQPFSLDSYHHLELKSLLTSLVTVYIGMYFQANHVSMSHIGIEVSSLLFAVILVLNAFFLISWLRDIWPLIRDTLKKNIFRIAHFHPVQVNPNSENSLENPSVVISPEDVVIRERMMHRHSTV